MALVGKLPAASMPRPGGRSHQALRSTAGLFLSLVLLAALPAWPAVITSGPMPGHASSQTANVWLQTDAPAEVQIRYWPERYPGATSLSSTVQLDKGTDFTTRIELTGLQPSTPYRYVVLLDGQPASAGEGLRLVTAPPPGKAVDFTVYLGSCAHTNDPPDDPKAYGGGYGIFRTIAGQADRNPRPHFMLWLGDHVYFWKTETDSPWAMNARYRQARALPELQPLLQATRHYAIWDDHDYGPNDSNRSFVFKDDSLDLFRRYWANPGYGLRELPGIFTTFSYGDVDFFLLDDRFYRADDRTAQPKNELDLMKEAKDWVIAYNPLTRILGRRYAGGGPIWLGESKVLFGPEQIDWLKQALIQSRASFKVIASGSQLFNDASREEGWHNFPGEREAFLTWLKEQNVPGVLFLSGDRHHTELLRRKEKDLYPIFELTCSPLTSSPRFPDRERDNPLRMAGTLVQQRNFCTLEVSGPADERRLTFRVFDGLGRQLWTQGMRAGELGREAASGK